MGDIYVHKWGFLMGIFSVHNDVPIIEWSPQESKDDGDIVLFNGMGMIIDNCFFFLWESYDLMGWSTFLCEHLSIESYWILVNRCDPRTCAPCNCRWTAFWWQVMTTKNRAKTKKNVSTSQHPQGYFQVLVPNIAKQHPNPWFFRKGIAWPAFGRLLAWPSCSSRTKSWRKHRKHRKQRRRQWGPVTT